MTENDFVKSWHRAIDYAMKIVESDDERYYVADMPVRLMDVLHLEK